MSKRTPGPWEVWRGDVWSASDYLICNVNRAREVAPKANARLIAAAPDLLAALQGLMRLAGPSHIGPWDVARAAIRKATEETP